LVQKDNVPDFPLLSPSEQLRGDMALKVWETNLAERKIFSREVKEAFLEALSSLDKGLIDLKGSDIAEALGKIDIEMNQQNSIKSKEETLAAIQKMSQIDLLKINKWLVNPSLQLQATTQEVKRIQERLPQVERKLFTFEVNETIEPSRFVVELLIDATNALNMEKQAYSWKQVKNVHCIVLFIAGSSMAKVKILNSQAYLHFIIRSFHMTLLSVIIP
jgi:hypothetical protein